MSTASHLAYGNDVFIASGGLRQLPIFGGELLYSHLIDSESTWAGFAALINDLKADIAC